MLKNAADTDKIRRWGHERLSTYGIGRELAAIRERIPHLLATPAAVPACRRPSRFARFRMALAWSAFFPCTRRCSPRSSSCAAAAAIPRRRGAPRPAPLHGDEGGEARVLRLDALEAAAHQLLRGELPPAQERGQGQVASC